MGDFSLNLNGIIAILAIITAITIAYFANWRRNRKSLSYVILYNTPLLTASEKTKEDLQVLYKGIPVKNPQVGVLKVINNGKQPIDDKDFKKPFEFVFDENVQILSVETLSTNPDNLKISASVQQNKISIEPVLLNSKDFIEIKVIINGDLELLKADARIVGVNEVKQIKEKPNLSRLITSVSLLLISIALGGVNDLLVNYIFHNPNSTYNYIYSIYLLILIPFVLLCFFSGIYFFLKAFKGK